MAGPLARRVVLVTGASQGVGLALGRLLVEKDRYRVVLTARAASLARLREAGFTEGEHVWPLELDVADPGSRERAIFAVTRRWGGVDVLVNNAGTMVRAVLEHATEDDHLEQLGVNYRGPMELIRLVLPRMRAQRYGRILNVSSVGGMMAMPTMSVYSASKFAMEGASEALYYEVRPWNIWVSLVQPGFINSGAIDRIGYTASSRFGIEHALSPYHAHYHFMAAFIAKLMRLTRATPESVARRMARLIEQRRPPLRAAGTFDAQLFSTLRRLLPRTLYHEVLYRALPGISRWGRDPTDPKSLPQVSAAPLERQPLGLFPDPAGDLDPVDPSMSSRIQRKSDLLPETSEAELPQKSELPRKKAGST